MRPVSLKANGADILYDAETIDKIDLSFFEPACWRARNALIGEIRGRATVWVVRHSDREFILRHYRRGGMLGPWLGDRYLWIGLGRTRAWREWHLLAELYQAGLPVPRPVAACVRRVGAFYRADLLTLRISGAESLAHRLARAPLELERWRALGHCLRLFHDAGVCHADLNAHNVLLTANDVYVVDFDRGRRRPPGSWPAANIARLRRSLDKLARMHPAFAFDEEGWNAFRAGYDAP